MDFKRLILFSALLVASLALENEFTEKTTYQDKGDDGNIHEIAKTPDTDKKMEDILVRMEQLEAREKVREKTYMKEIQHLRRQLFIQTRRTSSLERLVKSMYKKDSSHVIQEPEGNEQRIKSPGVQSINVQESQRIRRAENEHPVAFFASLNQHLTNVGAHQPITFNNVVTNIGNAYNSHFGSFIAPVPGTYVFSATLLSHYHSKYHAQFVKNGQGITYMIMSGSESDYGTMSQTVVLQLQKGDDVCVQNLRSEGPIYGDNYTTFSGFLQQEDFSSVEIVGK
ncbi:heavy metal-binding protein HIP-like [Mercenaria mercenaria]|uniref:heavy metal-binding protein HIP-like n=1 Tax=Mercenaria mercenaria TaxID=6596 RepID=UPI00234EFCED|nr:heavy metal-binding protein HIP-like [Mercenaria mercenaria]